MHFTRKELVDYIMHCDSKLEREQAEQKADKFLRFVAKKRKIHDIKPIQLDAVIPKRDESIDWKGKSVQELKEIEKVLKKTPS